MKLYHLTPSKNKQSIIENGLIPFTEGAIFGAESAADCWRFIVPKWSGALFDCEYGRNVWTHCTRKIYKWEQRNFTFSLFSYEADAVPRYRVGPFWDFARFLFETEPRDVIKEFLTYEPVTCTNYINDTTLSYLVPVSVLKGDEVGHMPQAWPAPDAFDVLEDILKG